MECLLANYVTPQVRFTLLQADRLPMIADRDAEAVVRGSEEIMEMVIT